MVAGLRRRRGNGKRRRNYKGTRSSKEKIKSKGGRTVKEWKNPRKGQQGEQ
jgi:hypothetical protein